jgi:hypothetical protein
MGSIEQVLNFKKCKLFKPKIPSGDTMKSDPLDDR